MAVIRGAVRRLIAPGSNDPRIIPIGVILHVAVSSQRSLFDFFKRLSGGIESHFYIRKDGTFEQYRDTDYEADANYRANSFVRGGRRYGFISIETEGFGPGEWTPEQIRTIKYLLTELAKEHGEIRLRKCPGPFEAGVGYHVLFGAPSDWTPVAKSCPGNARIRQFERILVPWMNAGGEGDHLEPRFVPTNYFLGAHGPWVQWLGTRLVIHGFDRHHDGNGYQPGKTFTKYDRRNVRDFQLAQGWVGGEADGFPGPETLHRLAQDPEPEVAPAVGKPRKPRRTRVQNARENMADAAATLRKAQQVSGRDGWVATAAATLERLLRKGPKK